MANPGLNITLQRESEAPLYRQLIEQIRGLIDGGDLPGGARLPASRGLARQLGVSRISVVNAYSELRAAGYLSAHAGRGTFVARERSSPDAAHARRPAPTASQRASAIRGMMRLARRPGVIDFSGGAPPGEFFPLRYLQDAINHVFERDGADALAYEVPAGYPPLRSAVRDYVRAIGIDCRVDDVLITGGAQQAIDLVLQSMMRDGETLVTADPTYLGIIDIAEARRVHIHGIPIDEHGIRIDALENALDDLRPRLIYVMPSYQNPTGHLMPLHRRRQLVQLAARRRIPILEDEVYREFRYDGDELPPLKALDESGVVIHTNAFTKVLLPGIRIGYLVADGPYSERLARVKQAADISTPGLNQRAIHLLLQRGVLAKQLERNRLELRRRRVAALAAAQRYLPAGSGWHAPGGGLFLWVELPQDGPSAAETFIAGIQRDVAFAIGALFYTGDGGSHAMRLNFGIHKPETIEAGFKRIGAAWAALVDEYGDVERGAVL
ncbi:MAG: PLP-dependent aminotransferase family protein [Chloroflexota bacterium]|nr:PLP-dependent aminotransferase family protein [Chloroflexota bacterium]MDE2947618.1 PLP-dependent aminotransferase family protein [Chloroflexota bacterium]